MGGERVEPRGRLAGRPGPRRPGSRGIGPRESQRRIANISSASARQPLVVGWPRLGPAASEGWPALLEASRDPCSLYYVAVSLYLK